MKLIVFAGLLAAAACSPVVLIPGLESSKLQGWVSKSSPTTLICSDPVEKYFRVWLNAKMFMKRPECLFLYMYRIYDTVNRNFTSIPGVKLEAKGVGRTWPIERTSPSTIVYEKMVKYLVKLGYVKGVNITGFPYDFRKGNSENQDEIEKLRLLVEKTYKKNGNQKVVIICHSMGGLVSLTMLNSVSTEWKEKYVDKLISIAGAYGGTVAAPLGILTGITTYDVNTVAMRYLLNTFSSLFWLFPNKYVFPLNQTIVSTPSKNYTSSDLNTLLIDSSNLRGASIHSTQNYNVSAPGVEVYCIYSTGVSTVNSITYDSDDSFPTSPSSVGTGDGDGTLNKVSLEVCPGWASTNSKTVHVKHFTNISHSAMITNLKVIKYVATLL